MRAAGSPAFPLPLQKSKTMTATADPDRHDGRDRRRWSRYEVNGAFPAILVTEAGRIACRIENISLTGARIRTAEPVPPPAQLRLAYEHQSGPDGRCAWSNADRIGLSFGFSDDSVALAMACLQLAARHTTAPSKTSGSA